jgi:formate dehydrogenase subunit delta
MSARLKPQPGSDFPRHMHKCGDQRRHRIALGDHETNAVGDVGSTIGMLRTVSARPSVSASFEHIRKFWDLRMRTAILTHLDSGGTGLDPDVRAAIATLKGT